MSTDFTSNYRVCAGREIHYTEWGAQHAETVVAWHGLARTGRDMDDIAAHLSKRWRVICPDTLGRGLSQWSPAPDDEYCLAFYEQLAVSLLDQLGIHQCLWLGTSMGGAIGLHAAAGGLAGRIRRLVMNDIGPELAKPAVERIRSYAGSPAAFAAIATLAIVVFSLYLLYDLKRIVDGGETNYIAATLGLYLSLYNIFQSLLALLGIFGGDRE